VRLTVSGWISTRSPFGNVTSTGRTTDAGTAAGRSTSAAQPGSVVRPACSGGDVRTLREVVELYGRGGNVAPIQGLDGTPIEPLGVPSLAPDEIDAIVAFLESLTDERVPSQRAPFDHPQLFVPNGHPGNSAWTIDTDLDGRADDRMVEIPAVGAAGGAPLPGFLEGVFGPSSDAWSSSSDDS